MDGLSRRGLALVWIVLAMVLPRASLLLVLWGRLVVYHLNQLVVAVHHLVLVLVLVLFLFFCWTCPPLSAPSVGTPHTMCQERPDLPVAQSSVVVVVCFFLFLLLLCAFFLSAEDVGGVIAGGSVFVVVVVQRLVVAGGRGKGG